MKINEPRKLPVGIVMRCYACEERPATHVCRYQLDELMIQVCLCKECMKIDTEQLLKNTIGIGEAPGSAAQAHLAV